jgi:hypothetical protein
VQHPNARQDRLLQAWRSGERLRKPWSYGFRVRARPASAKAAKKPKTKPVVLIRGRDELPYTFRERCLQQMGFVGYAPYLASPLWRRIRRRVLERCRGLCERCQARAEQVHHFRYTWHNLRGKSFRGLDALCRDCHTEMHPEAEPLSPAAAAHLRSIAAESA